MIHQQHIVERDDGFFEIGLADPAGPFESRLFAEAAAIAIAQQRARHEHKGVEALIAKGSLIS
ncbi:hypothetical protein IVB33_07580 [Bradyrhizobium sp. 24]|uniref:hypothetical protein n=1 Tax=unclassified Bradyrhizobium TaxID=2631580 RepID=UPI001FF7AC55|nr:MULTISPECIES: hypothetical protein [unclassified Bradyrhizobium]MCK1299728.1 hypothetical protein [Bradyrhizobium sp. 37]MCK1378093.1 hypothetical protein [Bradyrhizobium sp. 24]MCK1771562.1 hypothetical protein [Bradyrhizobium sp. 134]